MYKREIVNPNTGRKNAVRAWKIEPREILAKIRGMKSENIVREISFMLLEEPEVADVLEEEEAGEDARSNFALSIFENALDWRLGLAVIAAFRSCPKGKIPKPFDVAVNRGGDVFIITASGKVFVM